MSNVTTQPSLRGVPFATKQSPHPCGRLTARTRLGSKFLSRSAFCDEAISVLSALFADGQGDCFARPVREAGARLVKTLAMTSDE